MYKSECKILTSKIDVNLKFINLMNFKITTTGSLARLRD